ncbi:TolC family protein [Escherichia coli]|uniref:TolC family protein n=1 Tax=Escherichia coli TaxID=562 RepID=UPI0038B6434D
MSWLRLPMDKIEGRAASVIGILLTLNGCAMEPVDRAPVSPLAQWHGKEQIIVSEQVSLSLSALAEDSQMIIDTEHAYQLPELINIAQLNNPDTRIAWHQARQAALAVGLTESVFLPMITASVVGGYQHTRTPLPYAIGDQNNLQTNSHEVVPALVLQWLLFDFGHRRTIMKAAEQTSFAANMYFNGTHQKIIFDVMRTYYHYGAARSRRKNATEMLTNSQKILDATEARRIQGIATIVELAQARQLVAQAELSLIVAGNSERDALQGLNTALGMPANTQIKVDFPTFNTDVKQVNPLSQKVIEQALARRPDVLASYALAKAAKEGISTAEANYLPKIYLAGSLATGNGQFDILGLPSIGQQTSSSNILIGVTLPLYDGGIRTIRLQEARSRANLADEIFKKNCDAAAREIVVAADILQSAVASGKAASHLVKTAEVTYDAALDAYKHGLSTITVANEAANNLLTAKQTDTDARAAVLVAAANLAFVMGDITQTVTSSGPELSERKVIAEAQYAETYFANPYVSH